jgi:hypothetical protein
MIVEVGDAVHRVDNEQDLVGLFYGEMHLLVDLSFKDVVGVDYPATGVDNGKFAAVPIHVAILAVARGAGGFVDDCRTRFCQAVEKGGFAHVRAAYNGD